MGKLILYGMFESAPVRAVLLTLKALNLEYELRIVDVLNGENKTEEFIKKNPQHSIPVLEDDGQFLWDSHAIVAYLVRKYGNDDALYPKDFFKRAVVDQRLHFDSGVLFPVVVSIAGPILFKNVTEIPQDQIDLFNGKLEFLETFLEHDYVAGDVLTVADFSIISTLSTFENIIPIDSLKMPRIAAWIKRISELEYYEEANGKGAALVTKMLKDKLTLN